jgi:polyisoprenoid-binding protein YceI
MMTRFIQITLLLVVAHVTDCFPQIKADFESGQTNFVIKNAGLKVNGSLQGLVGHVLFDQQNNTILKIEGSVESNTISTGIKLRDTHLKKSDYFNSNEYPKIFMTSTQLQKSNKKKYSGVFDLTIKNVTKSISFPFTFTEANNSYTLQGEFAVNRLDFGLGEESIILSDTVKIIIKMTGKTN